MRFGLAVAALALPISSAWAQCPVIDFEDFAPGTVITTQYPGVTFSVVDPTGGSCGFTVAPQPRILTATNGTCSGTRGLEAAFGTGINGPCEFHAQYMRIVLSSFTDYVSFCLGANASTAGQDYQVRLYSTASGGAPFQTINVNDVGPGVFRKVVISLAFDDIRRVEVQGFFGPGGAGGSAGVEVIDDLQLVRPDVTPPTAILESPGFGACACDSIAIVGETCEDDGTFALELHEYQSVFAAPDAPWTFIEDFTSPLCGGGSTLLNWNTTTVPNEGTYYYRLTSRNACGLTAEDRSVIFVSKNFDGVAVSTPVDNGKYAGIMCIEGTVGDTCGTSYTVDYRQGGGPWLPVNPGTPVYPFSVSNDPLANWTTTAVADGLYQLRIRGTNNCGQFKEVLRNVRIDNTPPVANIASPLNCDYANGVITITGTASDTNFASYVLEYIGGFATQWTPIASSTTPVVNGVLASWNTASLPSCAYAIRLRVLTDVTECCEGVQNATDHAIFVLGCEGDINFDENIDQADLNLLLANFGLTCP